MLHNALIFIETRYTSTVEKLNFAHVEFEKQFIRMKYKQKQD